MSNQPDALFYRYHLTSDSFIAPLISEHRKQLETVQRLLAPLIETRRQEIMGKEDSTTDQWVSTRVSSSSSLSDRFRPIF